MSAHVFGQIGEAPVFEVGIASRAGASAKILTWGAVLHDLVVPSSRGPQRVILGLRAEDLGCWSGGNLSYSPDAPTEIPGMRLRLTRGGIGGRY